MWQRKKSWKRPGLKNHSRQYTSLNTNRNSAERQEIRKASVENFFYHEGPKLSTFTLLNCLCFLLEIFPNSVRCRRLPRDHVTSNNEKSTRGQHCKIYDLRETKGRILKKVLQPRSQGSLFLLRERTLVAPGHMAPRILEPKIREGKKSK